MRVYLVRHRGALDVKGSIATHRLSGEWGGVTEETLVEATPEEAERIRRLEQVVQIDIAPAGLYVGDRRGVVVIESGGSWHRVSEAEIEDYKLST